jgi:hypothetical protein
VAMIHSFSAADPTDPQTIAGRWLSQGAYTYFGAVNEPYLLAFRSPGLVAALLAAEVPVVAALRQGELEPFGFPWRLVYLGDPLYRLQTKDAVRASNSSRLLPGEWRKIAPAYENWPVAEITARSARSSQPARGRVFNSEDDRFRWCLDASLGDLAGLPSDGSPLNAGNSLSARSPTFQAHDWRGALREIRRDQLGQKLRPLFDDLLIDALDDVGSVEELMARLTRIPPAERGPQVWQALETGAMQRLARMFDDRDVTGGFVRALDLWDQVMRLNWPQSAHFPAHFSERVGTLALADAHWSRLWIDHLRRTDEALAAEPGRSPQAGVIAAERARVKAQLGGLGSSR